MRFPQADLFPTSHEAIKVGGLYFNVTGVNPATELGYGVWAAFGAGRCLVGVDAGDPDFDAAEKTSGAKTVTLTEAQMPSHTHTQNAHNHLQDAHSHTLPVGATDDTAAPFDRADAGTNAAGANATTNVGSTTATCQGATAVNQNTGGGQAHNNVQPSIAGFMWKRTA